MDPISVSLIAIAGTVSAASYVKDRHHLSKGDVLIHNEADRLRLAEQLEGGPKDVFYHPYLHHDHPLNFNHDDPTPFSCNACTQYGAGNQYSCKPCNVDFHRSCAISEDITKSLITEGTKLVPFVHSHELTLLKEAVEYTCSFCNNKSKLMYRYYCRPCNTRFELMCVNHPARLLSFLHPQHELELKRRHSFAKCSICRHGGETNSRVYTCEGCEFYVHPSCAVKDQYAQHPSHGDHTLVFGAVPIDKNVNCATCGKKCKRWCYLCPVCDGVYFHPECIGSSITSTSSFQRFGEEFGESFAEGFAEEVAGSIGEEIGKGLCQAFGLG